MIFITAIYVQYYKYLIKSYILLKAGVSALNPYKILFLKFVKNFWTLRRATALKKQFVLILFDFYSCNFKNGFVRNIERNKQILYFQRKNCQLLQFFFTNPSIGCYICGRCYGSGSGSDLWKVTAPVPTFEKLRFRFQFSKSYGSSSCSGSGSVSRPKKAVFKKILPF